jgi:hypothetical protein
MMGVIGVHFWEKGEWIVVVLEAWRLELVPWEPTNE